MKKILTIIVALLLSIALFGCSTGEKGQQKPVPEKPPVSDSSKVSPVVYKNDQYDFTFALPDSWRGYSLVEGNWEGRALGGTKDGQVSEKGPLLSIRHPQWTVEKPRQDIPIMIFTLEQWKLIEQEKLSVGAAPVGPKELAQSSKYVFALPARYNYAFPLGFEEVEKILEGQPLQIQ